MTSFDTTQIPTSSLTLDEVDCTYSTLIPQDDLSDRVSHSFQSPTVALLNRLKDLFEQQQETQWPSKKWPTQRAYKDAYKFITLLPLMDIPEPEIRFADDGEINFLWHIDGLQVHVDLGFYGTGRYSFYGRNSQGDEILSEDILATDGLTDSILQYLTS